VESGEYKGEGDEDYMQDVERFIEVFSHWMDGGQSQSGKTKVSNNAMDELGVLPNVYLPHHFSNKTATSFSA
jgi:hypothetical protein